nr:pentatricopeptide repeat protein AaPPR619 [Agave angustifolia]
MAKALSALLKSPFSNLLPHHPILPLLQQAQTHHHHHHKHLDLKSLHAHTITSGLIADPFAASRIIQFFLHSNPNNPRHTLTIFDSLKNPDAYTWNLMIAGYMESGLPESSIAFYFRMRASGAPPNNHTFALLVKACIGNVGGGQLGLGRLVHGQVFKCGAEEFIVVKNSLLRMYCVLGLLEDARKMFEKSACVDLISWNTLVSAYGKNGDVGIAQRLFERMPKRNLVSWSALVDGYVRSGDFSEALRLFDRFRAEGIEPDEVILVSVLKACAHLGALDQGRTIHRYVDHRFERVGNVVLETALIDMYCKCGCLDEAIGVFDRVGNGDVVLWNAMIGGLAMHGDSQRALDLFRRMKEKQPAVVPNKSTYIAVLSACRHAGMVDEGIEIFDSMKRHGVEPHREHYGCLADLMGRAGRVREAEEVLLAMPMEPAAAQWGALMSACQTHKDIEVGERVGRRLIEMEPFDGGRYVLLANLYTAAGQWEKANEIRKEMAQKGVKKEIGHSLIEHKTEEFIAQDSADHKSRK